MEVAASDNEHIPRNRKRHRVPATVQEEEDAVPAQTPRSRHRSQSSACPGTPLTSDHRTRPSTTPRRPHRATTRGRHGHAQRSRSTSAERSAPIFNGERRLLLTSRRVDNSRNWNERCPLRFSKLRHLRMCRRTFSRHQPAARNPERSHQHQMDRAQDRSHYRNEWNAPLRASQVHQHPSQHTDRAASRAAARLPAPRTRARDSARCRNN